MVKDCLGLLWALGSEALGALSLGLIRFAPALLPIILKKNSTTKARFGGVLNKLRNHGK